ncbi:MAG: PPC domain-containing protein [Verrucomicrobiae bacterium]|nr:PPC domain-containing protein [Verrucomicrobiae bacterium]
MQRTIWNTALWLLVPMGLLAPAQVHAQPVPQLGSTPVTWFQRGTTLEVTLPGEALAPVDLVLLTGSGMSGLLVPRPESPLTLESSAGGLSAAPEASKSLTVRLTVDPDAPLGVRELRVASPDGVSNPLTLEVSDLPELLEYAAAASVISLPAGISGVIGANTEVDTFRFRANRGDPVVLDVQANRFGSPLDPTLVVLDADGKELARSEDVHGLDPFLVFLPPADGEYRIRISDLRFQGGGDYRYRLVAGALPYLESLFPFGGRRGSTVELELDGHLLEESQRMVLDIAADAPTGRQEIRARTPRGRSNPLPFETTDLPEFRETEPNNSKDKAGALPAPGVVNGKIGTAGDVDFFRITSAADQNLAIEVHAHRFGSALDALLTLMDDQGTVLQRNDDAGTPDARLEFEARKGTAYLVSVQDLTDRGGPRFGYRLTVQPPDRTPDFAVRAPAGRFRIPRGGHLAIRCEVERRHGFDGMVRIQGAGLPPGVSSGPLVLGTGTKFGWLILSADEETPLGHAPLRLTASGEQGGRALVHDVSFPEAAWLTVLPAVSFSIAVAPPAIGAEQNGAAELEVSVSRRDGFDGAIRIVAEELPGVSVPAVVIPGDQSRVRVAVRPAYNSETGIRPVMLRGETGEGAGMRLSAAPAAVPLNTSGIPMFLTAMLPGSPFFRTDPFRLSAVALPTNSASAASRTEFVVKVDRRGLPGEIALSLDDLPDGVLATVAPIPADKNEVTIRLQVTDAAETGRETPFTVTGSATHNDRIWRQKTQPITLVIAAPEPETAAIAPARDQR